ncbi:hypothetical protein F4009_05495 [Candidatus Poribacteria bacterium]|nr:hypothetical protein [Candidatus Poribacteria bacterium]MYH83479.1 hypothetical protein [Candidatus Poribacteria bacterium]MYK93441.1 hypothetical protein [Candidatus Poribacteria bacterium]
MKEDRHIYMFTPAGWQHLETGKVVESGGIPLDAEDVQRLKELYLEEEVNSDQSPVTREEKRSSGE